jgi:hypothetical protein
MRKTITRVAAGALLLLIGLTSLGPVAGQLPQMPPACKNLAFSTEEDFVTEGPLPPDGDPIISDGDLLTAPLGGVGACTICARNRDLLSFFDVAPDLGLDAVDLIDVDAYLVAFSTELNSPNAGQFTAGDLLVTTVPYVVILNQALTAKWGVPYDIGLDGVQFVGESEAIVAFLDAAAKETQPITADALARLFGQFSIDIWFSTEGTWAPVGAVGFLDGDLLSANSGVIVAPNADLLPGTVPAGLPQRGVDFGLDAVATDRAVETQRLFFSTEILFDGEPTFTDGDVLRYGNGVFLTNGDLINCFEPKASFLGLDALSMSFEAPTVGIQGKKFDDQNMDGELGADEPGLKDWEIHADGTDAAGNAATEVTLTDEQGDYGFSLPPGSYTISEVCLGEMWRQTKPAPLDGCGSGVYEIALVAGDPPHTGIDFGNHQVSLYLPVILRNYG